MINIFYKFLKFLSSIFLLLLVGVSIFYINISLNNTYDIQKIYQNNNLKIYDRFDNLISNEGKIVRTYIDIDNISSHMKNAIVAIEDDKFFYHNGISYKGILRATYKNIKNKGYNEGASTITQQLVKNIYLKNNKNIKRKIKEIDLAIKLEKQLTKNQILEAYLNNILYGNNIYGIYEAAHFYFNKDPINLNINESATLAGLIQMPNYYNPFKNMDKALERRNIVLNKMYEQNYITEYEYNLNTNDKIHVKSSNYDDYYNMYIDYLYEYININNIDYKDKINIYMDKAIQQDIIDIYKNKYNTFSDNMQNMSIVVLENTTGGILGMGSNRFYQRCGINYTNVRMQPGSTIKPILDYGPAFEYKGYSPATPIVDEPFTYSNGTPIHNWDYKYDGMTNLRNALYRSRNVPALKMFLDVGEEKALEFAKNLNIIPDNKIYESEAIGASTSGYTLLNLANAYQAFANMGTLVEYCPIHKIDNIEVKPIKKEAISKSTAFLINDILHYVFLNTKYNLDEYYLCGKTGTTSFSKDIKNKYNYDNSICKDSYAIGYTKDLTVAVWTGYDDVSHGLNSHTKNAAKEIMKLLLSKYAKDKSRYEIPNNIKYLGYETIDGKIYKSNNGLYDYFIEGYEPLSYYYDYDFI